MDRNIVLSLLLIVVLSISLAFALVNYSSSNPALDVTRSLDFTVSGSSDCLRFLNSSVPAIYVPFTVAANQKMQLTINCTKMPGGANGYTAVYVYDGYWNGGTNYTCTASDLYPILSQIQSVDCQIRLESAYAETFGSSTQQSYTVFFVIPPGGQQATFHVTLKPV